MRAYEFVAENRSADNQVIWDYIEKTHPPEESTPFLKDLVMKWPRYELRTVPLSKLKIPPPYYPDDAEEQDQRVDPYGRTLWVDYDYAGEVSAHNVDRLPIVVDPQGHIIDGNHRAWAAAELLNRDSIQAWVAVPALGENIPQPGPSSDTAPQFSPNAKVQNRQMTAKQIISSIPGVPYYNNVVDDYDAKDFSWNVTKKVIEYANYLKQHPETLSKLPPIVVLNGKFRDGAHRVSAIWLLQQRIDPKNPLWANAKLNVQLVQQDVAENFADGKVKGKSRPGRVKRSGASCKGSVTDLRARAKKYGGERGKMYHWCANMKAGRKKANESQADSNEKLKLQYEVVRLAKLLQNKFDINDPGQRQQYYKYKNMLRQTMKKLNRFQEVPSA